MSIANALLSLPDQPLFWIALLLVFGLSCLSRHSFAMVLSWCALAMLLVFDWISYAKLVFLVVLVACPVAAVLFALAHVRSQTFHQIGITIVSATPWVLIFPIYSVALHLRLTLDRSWPWPWDTPDYTRFPPSEDLIRLVLSASIIFYFWIAPLWIGWCVIRRRQLRYQIGFAPIGIFMSGLTAAILLHWYDPGGFWFWAIAMSP